MFVRKANREDHDQIASDLGLHCLDRPLVFEILEHPLYIKVYKISKQKSENLGHLALTLLHWHWRIQMGAQGVRFNPPQCQLILNIL